MIHQRLINAIKRRGEQCREIERCVAGLFGVSDISFMTANYGKHRPCDICSKAYVCPQGGWIPDHPILYKICRACGIKKAKRSLGTPEKYLVSDLMDDFPNYTGEDYEILTKQNLWIYGEVGRGKTRLAFGICFYLIEFRNMKISYVNFKDLADLLKAAHKAPAWQSEAQILAPYLSSDLLFLDDVTGSMGDDDKATFVEKDLLEKVIRKLTDNNKRFIATSNYDMTQLVQKGFDPRTTSRIAELCRLSHTKTGYYQMGGVDRRLVMHL